MRGERAEARRLHEQSSPSAQRLAAGRAGQHRLPTRPVGLLRPAGDLVSVGEAALEASRLLEQSLAIGERLAETDPANTGYQRDLSVSYNRLGDLEVA